jgi:hypothetical protein
VVGRVAQPQILQHTAVAAGKGKRAPLQLKPTELELSWCADTAATVAATAATTAAAAAAAASAAAAAAVGAGVWLLNDVVPNTTVQQSTS